MRVFFTSNQNVMIEKLEVEALDILTNEYFLSIRESGVRITETKTKEEILDFNFADLKTKDEPEKEVIQSGKIQNKTD